ncbi:MAG: CHAT domain-containing protein, partial [Acidobacteriaceae bacterium]|nr:CHAT domain-containing protein [Acidobacteriaceae bacterium]
PKNGFVGIGDPIYNFADSRRVHSSSPHSAKGETTVTLARLVASDREIRTAANASGMQDVQLLEGREASSAGLKRALAKRPEILHFAVHVVSPDRNPQQAALALSLTDDNMPELLTPEAIETYRVAGSLVVLSGCSSAKGKVLPSAGLMGLTRAWLVAGASAVIATGWPTPDDSGLFFSCFYRHFQSMRSGSLAKRAAAALRSAQLEMEQSQGYRSSPSFWAAYSIICKE